MGRENTELLPLQLSNEEVSMTTGCGPNVGGQQRSKSAVLNSAVSGGLNAGAAEEKPLIKLNQISFKTQLSRCPETPG